MRTETISVTAADLVAADLAAKDEGLAGALHYAARGEGRRIVGPVTYDEFKAGETERSRR